MHKLASLLLTLSATTALVQAENIKGTVVDKTTKEPLIGATIQVAGSTMGTITDFDGKFELPELENKSYTLIISYVSYQTQEIPVDATKAQDLEITLSSDDKQLNEVTVVARKNLEGEKALLLERKKSIGSCRKHRIKRNVYQRYFKRRGRCQEDYRYLDRLGRTTDCTRLRRPL